MASRAWRLAPLLAAHATRAYIRLCVQRFAFGSTAWSNCKGAHSKWGNFGLLTPRRFFARTQHTEKETIKKVTRVVNEQIKSPTVKLIGIDGKLIGNVRTQFAIEAAKKLEADLVQVSAATVPPTCRIIKLEQEEQPRQKIVLTTAGGKAIKEKELLFGWNIADNDMRVKVTKLCTFLEKGHPVKVVIRFASALNFDAELAREMVRFIAEQASEVGRLDEAEQPVMQARTYSVRMLPLKQREETPEEREKRLRKEKRKQLQEQMSKRFNPDLGRISLPSQAEVEAADVFSEENEMEGEEDEDFQEFDEDMDLDEEDEETYDVTYKRRK